MLPLVPKDNITLSNIYSLQQVVCVAVLVASKDLSLYPYHLGGAEC